MKILAVCAHGNNRSVCLAFILKNKYGHDALACGVEKNSWETVEMLCKWAQKIIIVDSRLKVPDQHKNKVVYWDVGGDRYFGGFHPELVDQFERYYKTKSL